MPPLKSDKIAISVAGGCGGVRDLMGASAKATLSQRQKASLEVVEVKEPVWISEIEFSNPSEDDLRQAAIQAIQDSSNGNKIIDLPRALPVGAEWIGRRLEQSDSSLGASLTEEEKYWKPVFRD